MYSKSSARQSPITQAHNTKEPYRRQRTNSDSIRIPANYKGTAFNKNGSASKTYIMSGRSDTDIPDTSSSNIYSSKALPLARSSEDSSDNIARDIPTGYREEVNPDVIIQDGKAKDDSRDSFTTSDEEIANEIIEASADSAPVSKHFPFGHGIGYEELLLLGLILLLSENDDGGGQELNISQLILTALLFCG